MKRISGYIVLCFIFIGCKQISVNSSGNKKTELKLNSDIYDSIQVFVDSNISVNSRSEVYLLEFTKKRSDSIDYILTTLLKKSISDKYRNGFYFYNKDSSLLIVNSCNGLLFANSNIHNKLENIKDLKFSNDTGNVIFDPLIWKLTTVGDKIFIDRYYGVREAEKNVIVPDKKFGPAVKQSNK